MLFLVRVLLRYLSLDSEQDRDTGFLDRNLETKLISRQSHSIEILDHLVLASLLFRDPPIVSKY